MNPYLEKPIYTEVDKIIKEYLCSKYPAIWEEYYSLCWINILDSLDKFDEKRGKLRTFSVYIIRRTLQDERRKLKAQKRIPNNTAIREICPYQSEPPNSYESDLIDFIDSTKIERKNQK